MIAVSYTHLDGTSGFIYRHALNSDIIAASADEISSGKSILRLNGKKYRSFVIASSFDQFDYIVLIPKSKLQIRIVPIIIMEFFSILIMRCV